MSVEITPMTRPPVRYMVTGSDEINRGLWPEYRLNGSTKVDPLNASSFLPSVATGESARYDVAPHLKALHEAPGGIELVPALFTTDELNGADSVIERLHFATRIRQFIEEGILRTDGSTTWSVHGGFAVNLNTFEDEEPRRFNLADVLISGFQQNNRSTLSTGDQEELGRMALEGLKTQYQMFRQLGEETGIGAPSTLVVHLGNPGYMLTQEQFDRARRNLSELALTIQPETAIAIETQGLTLEMYYELMKMREDHPNIGFCVDTAHLLIEGFEGKNQSALIELIKPALREIHLAQPSQDEDGNIRDMHLRLTDPAGVISLTEFNAWRDLALETEAVVTIEAMPSLSDICGLNLPENPPRDISLDASRLLDINGVMSEVNRDAGIKEIIRPVEKLITEVEQMTVGMVGKPFPDLDRLIHNTTVAIRLDEQIRSHLPDSQLESQPDRPLAWMSRSSALMFHALRLGPQAIAIARSYLIKEPGDLDIEVVRSEAPIQQLMSEMGYVAPQGYSENGLDAHYNGPCEKRGYRSRISGNFVANNGRMACDVMCDLSVKVGDDAHLQVPDDIRSEYLAFPITDRREADLVVPVQTLLGYIAQTHAEILAIERYYAQNTRSAEDAQAACKNDKHWIRGKAGIALAAFLYAGKDFFQA